LLYCVAVIEMEYVTEHNSFRGNFANESNATEGLPLFQMVCLSQQFEHLLQYALQFEVAVETDTYLCELDLLCHCCC